eukprot:GFUD01116366.1.p1 GENE.GFUD01116366.1~~GFUD01116366.1.p1  ORF type:complete len:307 (+),score=28.06 GFUD01116366.1:132-1052(+)
MMKLLLLILQLALLNEAKTLESALKDSFKEETHVHFDLPARNNTARQPCPAIGDVPIVTPDRKEFYGVRYYDGRGHPVTALSCNGDYHDRVSGYNDSAPEGEGWLMGTLYVHAGCIFYGFSDYNYEGSYKEYQGPVFLSEVPDVFGNTCNGGIPCVDSYIVTCEQKMPDCVPDDRWTTVASFENSGSSLPSTFTYKYVIGTTWSNQMSEGFDVSITVSGELKASFWGRFEATIGVSHTTGYNWGYVSTQAKQERQEFTVETKVPGGKGIKIQQTSGSCGSSDVSTEALRSVEVMANGEFGEILIIN